MSEEQKTRILETLNASAADEAHPTRILGEATLDLREQPAIAEQPLPGILNAPPRSRWPGRLAKLLLLTVLGIAGWEWGQWTLAAWQWQPLAGSLLGLLGVTLAGTGLKAWWDVRRQRARLTDVEQLRLEMQAALADPRERLAVDWLERLQALYADTPLASRMHAACADLDQSHSADEIKRRLNQQFYQPLDIQARRLLQRDAVGTGLLVATSPWVTVDILLVIWRNMRMMRRIAVCYGLPISQLSSWRLARHVLRNIALAGGTEAAIGALSDSLLAGVLEKLAVRVGQGVGVGLYSARLGHFTLDLCRAAPLQDRHLLAEDNRGIIQGIKERLGRVTDDSV
ncbi:MAG: TIGR01620 family protein [Pseudomonas sp.]